MRGQTNIPLKKETFHKDEAYFILTFAWIWGEYSHFNG
jgi:hypothetical protein